MSASLSVNSGSAESSSPIRGGGGARQTAMTTLRIDIETIRLHMSSFVAKLSSRVSLDTLRPLPMFLGINPTGPGAGCLAAGAFTPPIRKIDKSSVEKMKSRVSLNFAFFLTNYVLISSMVALVVALMHPGMLFFVAIVYALWSFHSFLIRNELDLFGLHINSLLSIQQRFYFLFTVTAVVVVWKCLLPSLIFGVISSLLVCFHSIMRDPKHIEQMDLLDDGGTSSDDDEGGEGGSSGSEGAVLVHTPKRMSSHGAGGDVI